MELVVRIGSQEVLAAALAAGAGAVAVPVPRQPAKEWWSEVAAWQTAVRERGSNFYLVWDWLLEERALGDAAQMLAAVAQLAPEALVIRDLGLCREARRRFPDLRLHAAGNWGGHNSPGLDLAQSLGFSRVVLEAPLGLKDLALMRRQSPLPLEVILPPRCRGFPHLCLLEEYLQMDCAACGEFLTPTPPGARVLEALEMLPGLSSLGVEAVQVGEGLAGESLGQVIQLHRAVLEAPPDERSRVLSAAREVVSAFGEGFRPDQGQEKNLSGAEPPVKQTSREGPEASRQRLRLGTTGGRVWLEVRSFVEAAGLAREWPSPLVVLLTQENYRDFLAEHRRWTPKRLIWRLPGFMPETALSFYRQALETLGQGGYRQFVAGDWGGVALARQAGGQVYGDQTLGLRNSWALAGARDLRVVRVCLPPRRESWQDCLSQASRGSFWGYLYHFPALAVWPRTASLAAMGGRRAGGEKLRWVPEGEWLLLCKEFPDRLGEQTAARLQEQGVAPLVMALPRSGLPWGRVPAAVAPPPERRQSRS